MIALTYLCPPSVTVRGLPFLDASKQQLTSLLQYRLRHCRGTVIFTPNAKIGADCQKDPRLYSLLTQADILLPDGAGVLLASKFHAPRPLHHRLPGIEAGEIALHLAAEQGYPVYFLGGKEGVADHAAHRWQKQLPELIVAGTHHGYFDPHGKENDRVLQHIAASDATIVLACLGFPIQEQWIMQSRSALPSVRLWMGLGGSLDVWAGKLKRAPQIFRAFHLEWLWRMLLQPHRLSQLPSMLNYVFGR